MREQGYHRNIALGEVIAEAMVDSREDCGTLCQEHPVCQSVMLVGQLCRMFGASSAHQPVIIQHISAQLYILEHITIQHKTT